MTESKRIESSFRDPSGFVFCREGRLYRQINVRFKEDYDLMVNSGLYTELTEAGLLVPHKEADVEPPNPAIAYRVIEPETIPFISYPYEWCFSQLKDAALATIEIQKRAMEHGMSLKDCSSYNIQFYKGRPIFIDTLSFEKYQEGLPWVAYRQFCQHFLAPLALMAYRDVRLSQLFRIYIDGIPLDMASQLLPWQTKLKIPFLIHIHLHAKSQKKYADKAVKFNQRNMSRVSFLGLIDHLETSVRKLEWKTDKTEWGDYYGQTNYSSGAFLHKQQLVEQFLDKFNPRNIWDIGANEGTFSRIASRKKIPAISFDIDPLAVEKNYRECRAGGEANLLPLLLDLTNPSPGIGWQNKERSSFIERGPAEAVMALALIHHLAISNNLPYEKIANLFSAIGSFLIIEFIPKSDSQVQRLLATREDIFPDYNRQSFEREFSHYFRIQEAVDVRESERTIYFMTRKAQTGRDNT